MVVSARFHSLRLKTTSGRNSAAGLTVAVASQVLQMAGVEGFIFNFLFGKTLRSSFQAVVVRKNLDCR